MSAIIKEIKWLADFFPSVARNTFCNTSEARSVALRPPAYLILGANSDGLELP